MHDTTFPAAPPIAPPTDRPADLRRAADSLGDICGLLRPYDCGDLTDAMTRARYYALRSRATLLDAAGRATR